MTKDKEEKIQPTKTSLKWRLPDKLRLEDVQKMVDTEIITKEEAKELLFNEESKDEKIKALEKQVEFLQGVVERLSSNQPVQTIIKYVGDYTWPKPYRLTPMWGGTTFTAGAINSADFGTHQLVNNVMTKLKAVSSSNKTY